MILKKIKDMFLNKGILRGKLKHHDEQDISISRLLYAYTTEEGGPWKLWKGDNISIEIIKCSNVVKIKDNLYWRLDVGGGMGIMAHSIKDRKCNRYDAAFEYIKRQKTPKCISDETYNLRELSPVAMTAKQCYIREVCSYSENERYLRDNEDIIAELYDYMGHGYIEPKSFVYMLDRFIAGRTVNRGMNIMEEMRKWISKQVDMSKRLERESRQKAMMKKYYSPMGEKEFMDYLKKGIYSDMPNKKEDEYPCLKFLE